MKTIAILTSGGDAPGMNAAIRAASRIARHNGIKLLGSRHGFRGLVDDVIIEIDRESVSNIIHRGGSILRSSRCDKFETPKGREKALATCDRHGIEGLILIGGDGTMRGAVDLENEGGPPSVGLPGTIDNDIAGTDHTIGFDTAVNAALEAIDRIRDTAETMERMFFIETMGRHSGAIALAAGIGGGSNVVVVPETKTDIEGIAKKLQSDRDSGAQSLIVVVAEGDESGGAYKLAEKIRKITGMDSRVTVLGHIQRGGNPTANDRIIATCLGVQAVEDLMDGRHGHMLGWKCEKFVRIPFREAVTDTALPDEIVRHAATMLT